MTDVFCPVTGLMVDQLTQDDMALLLFVPQGTQEDAKPADEIWKVYGMWALSSVRFRLRTFARKGLINIATRQTKSGNVANVYWRA